MSGGIGAPEGLETLILEELEPGVVVLTLDRPDSYNAMTPTMFDDIATVARWLGDAPGLRVVVVTGAGRAFCSGYDLAEAEALPGLGALGMLALQERAARALVAFRSLRVPIIAAVNGAAVGGGLALALAADIRIAAPEAKFSAAFVKIGLSAGDLGTSWMLTRLVGPAKAAEFCFTARMVLADEARDLGLVNSVSAAGGVLDDALDMARLIAANSPGGVSLTKRALQAGLEISSYAAAIELENRGQALLSCTQDMSEALAAFTAGRPATFEGA